MKTLPQFQGNLRKNDALFLYGALQQIPFVMTYLQNKTEIIYGPSCKPAQEINLDLCEQDHVPVIPRRGGGGTVVLLPGMLVTIVVGEKLKSFGPIDIFNKIHVNMISILSNAGIKGVELKGISDLALNNRKILGSSIYMGVRPDLFYYQSSLIINSDLSLISRYLRHPPREPDYRMKRPHDQFCTSLTLEGFDTDPQTIHGRFSEHLQNLLTTH